MKTKKLIDQVSQRIGLLQITGGKYQKLGENAEAQIRSLIKTYGLNDLLGAIYGFAKNEKVEFYGHALDLNGRVSLTNMALSAIVSIALSEKISDRHALESFNKKPLQEAQIAVFESTHCFNDEFIVDFRRPDESQRDYLWRVMASNTYLQEKTRTVLKQLLSRAACWFAFLPQQNPVLAIPIEVNEFIRNEYGVEYKDLAGCFLGLWASQSLVLSDQTFTNIVNWNECSLKKFLERFSRDLTEYQSPWMMQKVQPSNLPFRLPKICEHPIIKYRTMDEKNIYLLPIPRLLFNHFEETFYWKCFDHFKDREKRPDNTFANWFGYIFEEYCVNLLKKTGSKWLEDIRFLEKESIAAPDLVEVANGMATFFEFKSRRLWREYYLRWDEKALESMKAIGRDIVDGFVRFAKDYSERNTHPLKNKIKMTSKMMFVVITPLKIPIDPYVHDKGWFQKELREIQMLLELKTTPKLVFGHISDLEALLVIRKKGNIYGALWKDYLLNKKFYPQYSFIDWFLSKKKSNVSDEGMNPYVEESFTRAFDDLLKDIQFKEDDHLHVQTIPREGA